jgi:hypothetical protein
VGVEGMRQVGGAQKLRSHESTGGASCHMMMVVSITGGGCGHNGNFYTSFIHVSSRSDLWPHIKVPINKALYSSVKGRRNGSI